MALLIVDSDHPPLAGLVAQGILAALRAAAADVEWRWHEDPVHPLRRDWHEARYADAADHAEALVTQARNFALRSDHDDGHWLLDGGLLWRQGPTPGDGDDGTALALLDAMDDADPAWLYVRSATRRALTADSVFRDADCRRIAVNAARATLSDAVRDGLGLLGASRLPPRGEDSGVDLRGVWHAPDRTIELVDSTPNEPVLESGVGGRWRLNGRNASESGTLIPCEPGVYLISGVPLRLELIGPGGARQASGTAIEALTVFEMTGGSDAEPTVFRRS